MRFLWRFDNWRRSRANFLTGLTRFTGFGEERLRQFLLGYCMPKSKKKTKRKTRLSKVQNNGSESYKIAAHTGTLFLFQWGRGKGKTTEILGDPEGLRFLANLLNEVADVDQTKIPDLNCPVGTGVHYHVYKADRHLHPKSNELVVGRLDGKITGSHKWFLPLADE
jgi:hypothetical protein